MRQQHGNYFATEFLGDVGWAVAGLIAAAIIFIAMFGVIGL